MEGEIQRLNDECNRIRAEINASDLKEDTKRILDIAVFQYYNSQMADRGQAEKNIAFVNGGARRV